MGKVCSIDGCVKPIFARGWCSAHWMRWRRHGSPTKGRTSPGELRRHFDQVVIPYEGDECLIWPHTISDGGYALIGLGGRKQVPVSRLVCEKLYGPPPSAAHQAAHSCGRGHRGCVAPKHLRWATPKENADDKEKHGTHTRGERNSGAKLTEADVLAIRRSGRKIPQRAIAERFGVSTSTVNAILNGKKWAWLQPPRPRRRHNREGDER